MFYFAQWPKWQVHLTKLLHSIPPIDDLIPAFGSLVNVILNKNAYSKDDDKLMRPRKTFKY